MPLPLPVFLCKIFRTRGLGPDPTRKVPFFRAISCKIFQTRQLSRSRDNETRRWAGFFPYFYFKPCVKHSPQGLKPRAEDIPTARLKPRRFKARSSTRTASVQSSSKRLFDDAGDEGLLGLGSGEGVEGELAAVFGAELKEETGAVGVVGIDCVDEAHPRDAVEMALVRD